LGGDDVVSMNAAQLSGWWRDRTLLGSRTPPDGPDSSANVILPVCEVLRAEHLRPTSIWHIISATLPSYLCKHHPWLFPSQTGANPHFLLSPTNTGG